MSSYYNKKKICIKCKHREGGYQDGVLSWDVTCRLAKGRCRGNDKYKPDPTAQVTFDSRERGTVRDHFGIRMPRRLLKALKYYCDTQGISQTELANTLIDEGLRRIAKKPKTDPQLKDLLNVPDSAYWSQTNSVRKV